MSLDDLYGTGPTLTPAEVRGRFPGALEAWAEGELEGDPDCGIEPDDMTREFDLYVDVRGVLVAVAPPGGAQFSLEWREGRWFFLGEYELAEVGGPADPDAGRRP